jgi:hypothetical protein
MVDLRQNSVPFIHVGLRRSRSWRERDHNAIDDDVIGTSFTSSLAHLGERALALSTRRHWRGRDQIVIIVAAAGSYVAAKRIAPLPRHTGRIDRGGDVCVQLLITPSDKLMNVVVVKAREQCFCFIAPGGHSRVSV